MLDSPDQLLRKLRLGEDRFLECVDRRLRRRGPDELLLDDGRAGQNPAPPEPYRCVPGAPPIDHVTLTAHVEPGRTGGRSRDIAGYAGNAEGG